jgi:hypothetical protein
MYAPNAQILPTTAEMIPSIQLLGQTRTVALALERDLLDAEKPAVEARPHSLGRSRHRRRIAMSVRQLSCRLSP